MGFIPARAGSVGVPGKCMRNLLGKPVISYSIEAAQAARLIDQVVVSSDDQKIKTICRDGDVTFIDRPIELAANTARMDDAMRHAVEELEKQHKYKADIVVLLYGNVPIRAQGIIDKAIDHLIKTGADSVQTLAPVGKYHPYWLYEIDDDRAVKHIVNKVYRRQDLPPLYAIDSAVGVVRRECLMAAAGKEDPYAFWGTDKRALVQEAHETVDIDCERDFFMAEAVLREKGLTRAQSPQQ